MKDTISYILDFLLYGNAEARAKVGYTADLTQWDNYALVIVPSGNMERREIVAPQCQSQLQVRREEGRIIVETDVVYATFFFLSRAEERLISERDSHGRLLAKHVTLAHNPQSDIILPYIDLWGWQLLELLHLPLPAPHFSGINLTHDVDTIAHYRHLRGLLGGIARGKVRQVVQSIQRIENDPAYTFPWLTEQDAKVAQARAMYFVKAGKGRGFDYPQYALLGRDFQQLKALFQKTNAVIGLHVSYEAGECTERIKQEKERLEEAIGQPIDTCRWHYLRTTQPTDFQALADCGIQHDYSMGFADMTGPRLRTYRVAQWINPDTRRLSGLYMHPLTVMDCTLSNANYMNLNAEEAYKECVYQLDMVHQFGGEVNLLWHNSNVTLGTYHAALYPRIITYLTK